MMPVAGLPGVSERVDLAAETVAITAAMSSLEPAVLGPAASPAPTGSVESGTGAVLNYDVTGTQAGGRSRTQALLDTRVFSPWGVLSTQAIGQAGAGVDRAIRLDSTYTHSDPDSLQRIRVGDLISSGLAWTRPVRLGGVQIARDFSLRPDLVTFPVPTIAGQVAVPSSVDVLINGVQSLTTQADAGPFEVRRLPIVTGASTVSLVVNNALGQQVTRTLPVYTSAALLTPGLDAYSGEIGSVRLGYGVQSDDYREIAGSASYRRGITDWLTLSGHAEGSPRLAMGGGGATVQLGGWAVGSVSVAGSTSTGSGTNNSSSGFSAARGRPGLLVFASIERITPRLTLSASAQWADDNFRDVASVYGDPAPGRALRVSAGYPVGNHGSLGVSYTRQRQSAFIRPGLYGIGSNGGNFTGIRSAVDPLVGAAFVLPTRTSLLTASYSTSVFDGRASFYATAFHDFDALTTSSGGSSTGLLFGITVPLGERSSVNIGAGKSGGQTYGNIQASRSVVTVGDTGGQFYATAGGNSQVLATGQYKSPWALLELDASHVATSTAWRGSANGALVLADGSFFASNPIQDSFAIVDTDGQAGLQVSYENRPVDRTDASGQVLVPDLRSYEVNRLSIDPTDLPFDADVGPTVKLVRPDDRSGVVVNFKIKRIRAALLRLVDAAGAPIPVGATVQVEPDPGLVPVGFDGEAYVQGLPPHARVRVVLANGAHCTIAFDYVVRPGEIPRIGPLVCRAEGGR